MAPGPLPQSHIGYEVERQNLIKASVIDRKRLMRVCAGISMAGEMFSAALKSSLLKALNHCTCENGDQSRVWAQCALMQDGTSAKLQIEDRRIAKAHPNLEQLLGEDGPRSPGILNGYGKRRGTDPPLAVEQATAQFQKARERGKALSKPLNPTPFMVD